MFKILCSLMSAEVGSATFGERSMLKGVSLASNQDGDELFLFVPILIQASAKFEH